MAKSRKDDDIALMKPYLPPLPEFQIYLERIWESRRMTNRGSIHSEFEKALCDYLGVKYICLFANGTLALLMALKALNLKGEVITTPYTYIATSQAIYWNNLKPVFADINETDLNLNISGIERAITQDTCAILPVHIFGNPCNTDKINELAHKHNLKVIYDAAHCFGVEFRGESICNFGDLSVLSFHATKVFNSFEGGAIICHDEITKKYIDALGNNGYSNDKKLSGYGLNAKMNEMQAAFGLVQLKYVDKVIAGRKVASESYRFLLKDIPGLRMPDEMEFVKYNYSYFPVIIDHMEFGASRDDLFGFLKKRNIETRKYFYPLVSDYKEFKTSSTNDLSVAVKIAGSILCIPLFHDISSEELEFVADSIILLHEKSLR